MWDRKAQDWYQEITGNRRQRHKSMLMLTMVKVQTWVLNITHMEISKKRGGGLWSLVGGIRHQPFSETCMALNLSFSVCALYFTSVSISFWILTTKMSCAKVVTATLSEGDRYFHKPFYSYLYFYFSPPKFPACLDDAGSLNKFIILFRVVSKYFKPNLLRTIFVSMCIIRCILY